MRVKSNLKNILDRRGISIRECARMADLPVETVRRLYNDETKQYQRDSIGALCEALDVEISDLLVLEKPPK
ncbi:helix-turn-helix domain-containing protein [Rummeliibacillus suwonensis]|uniref:helix-turn-helix domain-containing protein n=1 Tax=Rummeliibacillus suwonensis TaxID=1306154 RepID=UPI0011B3677D|nr:helix-turn-helix transcriptional regulator [Rummeliibacillus suwonensis]